MLALGFALLVLKLCARIQICCSVDRFPALSFEPSPRTQPDSARLQICCSRISPARLDFSVLQHYQNSTTNRMPGVVLTN